MGVSRMMAMIMVMTVIMIVVVMMVIDRFQPTHSGAEGVTQRTIRHIGPRRVGTLTLNMVVMAFLHRTNLCFKSKNLRAVFAQNTGRGRHRAKGGMTTLCDTDLAGRAIFNRKHLGTVAANTAVGRRRIAILLHDALGECL